MHCRNHENLLSEIFDDAIFIGKEYSKEFHCSLCKNILKSPKQTECGCRFCSSCLDKRLDIYCPNCPGVEINQDKIIIDKAIEKEIAEQLVECSCKLICKYKNLAQHVYEYHYQFVNNLDCKENSLINNEIYSNFNKKNMNKISFESNRSNESNVNRKHSSNNSTNEKSIYNSIEKLKCKSYNCIDVNIDCLKFDNSLKIIDKSNDSCWISQSTNGNFFYHIPNISRKIQTAKNGGINRIKSDPFYVFDKGYKISVKVYLNGNRKSRNKFLSVYCVLMKGDFDDYLNWPFQMKVIISICNSFKKINSVIISPNNNSICYDKPIKSCNIGFGEPEFFPISDLNFCKNLLINDELQIKFTFS